jgi:endonuclease/exonuclease/phosphatase family metal-dependent hydrolase
LRRLLRFLLVASAIAYPLAIAGVIAALAFVGEEWWATTVALYLPRVAFAAPLPFLALALLVWGPRWLLVGQAAAAALILFPLMGLELGGAQPEARGPTLTLLSYNVDHGQVDRPEVRKEIVASGADVVLLQGTDSRIIEPLQAFFADHETRRVGEFFVASRFAIKDVHEPPGLHSGNHAGFIRVTLETPLGLVDVYNVHPASPRRGFEAIRGEPSTGSARVEKNAAVRARQVAALAAHARAAAHPVIIAGDTNLPGLSPLLREHLGRFQDGFTEVGRGFGYTFPAHRWLPWMRIDRVLAGPELRFVRFAVGERRGSDHLCVIAELTTR